MTSDTPPSPDKGISTGKASGLIGFWQELKRRRVVRVAVAYAVVAWLIIQIAATTIEGFEIPLWTFRFVVIMLGVGFPIAVIIAWAFELTPDGIKTTKSAQAEQGEVPLSEKQQKKRNWMAYVTGAVIPTVIFGALAVFFYFRSGGNTVADVGEKSIAILPLENMSSNPENAYFADAMHDEIITNLANISDMVVIGRTSVRQYKDTVKTLEQIGKELNVRYLVEGSVFRDENQASINIQLIDTETRDHIWAQVYERILDEIMSIRAAVAIDVAEQLHAVLSPEETTQISEYPTENREAYDYYLKARQAFREEEEIPLVLKAIELDPDYYDAWGLLASASIFGFSSWKKNDPELLAYANKAIQELNRLKPDQGHLPILTSYEIHINHDLEAALRNRLKMMGTKPFNSEVGWSYLQLGRLQQALDNMEKFVDYQLESERPSVTASRRLYTTYVSLGLWNEGRALLERFLERGEELRRRHDSSSFDRGIYSLKRELAQHEFLKKGGLEEFVATVHDVPGFSNEPWGTLWSSLIRRDLSVAVRQINDIRSDPAQSRNPFSFAGIGVTVELLFRGQLDRSLNFEPLSLLAGLIHFTQGEKEKWLEETAQAKAYWEENIAAYHKVDPDYYAQLAICYALEGDREKMEALIPKLRELTQNVNWQFRRQAECEVKLAIAYLVLGDENKALDLLEKASELHSPMFINRELELWFIFDRLKGNPRFEALLAD